MTGVLAPDISKTSSSLFNFSVILASNFLFDDVVLTFTCNLKISWVNYAEISNLCKFKNTSKYRN